MKKRNRVVAWIFSFLFFVPGFNHSVHAVGDINILIVGDKGVGKSTLLHRLVTQEFEKRISEKVVQSKGYKHGEIYPCEKDYRIKIVEMDIKDEGDYMDYLYQNANIVIHMSDVKKPPIKQEISDWYDKFVRTIFRGLGDPRGYNEDFHTDPENILTRKEWFKPLQLQSKIGYIIFVCNKLDTLPAFSSYEQCRESWEFIDRMPSSRSILDLDSLSANGEGNTSHGYEKSLVTMNRWINSLSELSSFEPFDNEKKNLEPKKKRINLHSAYEEYTTKHPKTGWLGRHTARTDYETYEDVIKNFIVDNGLSEFVEFEE